MSGKSSPSIAIYSRKSRFTGKGESIENQIELCRQYIRLHTGEAEAENALVYEDEGFSGGNLDRPQFQAMMADAKAGRLSAIVVYRLDRISRNIGDFAGLIQALNDLRVSFVSIKEQFDTDSPMGRAMMYIASVFSQLERETIAERIRDNMHELAKTGRWLGGVTPTGYASEQTERVTVDGKVRKACRLKPVAEEAALVQLIFTQFLDTRSLTKTDAFLLQNGYTTKNGKRFSRFSIRGILTNPVYMQADGDAWAYLTEQQAELFAPQDAFDGLHGVMAYNRTLQKPGKTNQIRPISQWIVALGAHPGLISGADWVRVQRLLGQNKDKSYRKPRGNTALLSGVLYCGCCGGPMRPKVSQRCGADGQPLYSYLCSLKERSHGQLCSLKNISGNLIDQAVTAELRSLPEDSGAFARRLAREKRQLSGNQANQSDRAEHLRKALAENRQAIAGLVSALGNASGTAAEAYLLQQINTLHEVGDSLRRQAAALGPLSTGPDLSDAALDALGQRLSSLAAMTDTLEVEELRQVIRACVQRVVWDGETAHLYLFGAADAAALEGTAEHHAPLCEDSK